MVLQIIKSLVKLIGLIAVVYILLLVHADHAMKRSPFGISELFKQFLKEFMLLEFTAVIW